MDPIADRLASNDFFASRGYLLAPKLQRLGGHRFQGRIESFRS
jgi:hypothetical protein